MLTRLPGDLHAALVGMAAAHHGADLATRDGRALPTYRAVGVRVVLVGGPSGGRGAPRRPPAALGRHHRSVDDDAAPPRSRTLPTLARRTLVRVAGLLLLFAAFQAVAALDARLNPDGGANIGLGLLLLLGRFVAVAVWAGGDGRGSSRRGEGLRPWLLCWGLVAVIDAVLSAAAITGLGLLSGEAWTSGATTALLSDLAFLAPPTAIATAVAAALGLLAGREIGRRPAAPRGARVSG